MQDANSELWEKKIRVAINKYKDYEISEIIGIESELRKNSDFRFFLSWGRNRLPSIDTVSYMSKGFFSTFHQAKIISQQAAQNEVSFMWYHSFIFSRTLWNTLIQCFACLNMLTWSKMVLFYLSKYIRTVHPLTGPCVQLT